MVKKGMGQLELSMQGSHIGSSFLKNQGAIMKILLSSVAQRTQELSGREMKMLE